MRTTTTTALGKSVADGLAEAAYGPLRLVSHKRTVGVLLSPRDALSLGVICEHGEGPEECSVCGPAGRIGRHPWKPQAEWHPVAPIASDPKFWDDLVLSWARQGETIRARLARKRSESAAAVDRLLAAGKLVITRRGETPEADLIAAQIWSDPFSADPQAAGLETTNKTPRDTEEPGPHGPESAVAEPGSEGPGQGDSPRGTAEDPAGLECPECGSRLSGRMHGCPRCAGCGYYFDELATAAGVVAE